jgi:hypothetical protein
MPHLSIGKILTTLLALLLLSACPTRAALVGFYSFDDPGNPLADTSGSGNDLLGGAADPTYVDTGGVEGGAYVFDGTQRLISPISIDITALPTLTMGAWVKTSSLATGLRKVMGQDNGGWDRVLGLDDRNGPFRYACFTGGGILLGEPGPANTNDWTFLAVAFDQVNAQVSMYVDLNCLTIDDPLVVATAPTFFGSGFSQTSIGSIEPDNANEGWRGAIDNVFFYDEVLTPERLAEIRNGGRNAIAGSGGADPDVKVSVQPTLFHLAKSPAVQSFAYEIINVGMFNNLNIASVSFSGSAAARFKVTAFPAAVGPGATATIAFTFDSQGKIGLYPSLLTITSDDPNNPVITLDTTAQVGDDPNLAFTVIPNLQNFQRVPAVHPITFGITNDGVFETLHISRVTLSGPDAAYYAVVSFPSTLAPATSNTLNFTFSPQGQVGAFTATAVIESDDASDPIITLDLSAIVTATALIGFYPFDDETNPLSDVSGNNRTLLSRGVDPTYAPLDGFEYGAYQFSGGQRLVAPFNINPGPFPVLTMGAWVKATDLSSNLRKVMGHDDGGWDRAMGLDNRTQLGGGPMPNGTFRYAAFTGVNNNGPTQGDPPPTPTNPDAWTFLTAVYDQPNKTMTLYVDLDVSTTDDDPQAIVAAADMGTGSPNGTSIGTISPDNNNEGWIGYIDNVFFFNGGLDATTVRAIRDAGSQGVLAFRPDPILAVLTPDPIFGDQADAAPKTALIQITNSGVSKALVIVDVRISGNDAAFYSVGAVPPAVAPGETAVIEVTFNPQAREGMFSANLDIVSNDSVDRNARLDLAALVPYSPNPLIAFYPFDDPAHPLKNAGGTSGDLALVPGAVPTYGAANGVEGGAYTFTGTQRLIAPVNINAAELPQLTMGAWVKTADLTPGERKVMGHDDGGWDRAIGLDSRNGPFRYTSFIGNGDPVVGLSAPVSTEQWSFFAATYDQVAGAVNVYLDLDVSTTADPLEVATIGGMFGSGWNTTAIGSIRPDVTSEGWIGQIDNVFFYQTVLSVDELTAIRDGGAAAIVPPTPRILSVTKPGNLTLTWSSTASGRYGIEYAETLGTPFTQIATQDSQGATTSYIDSDAARMGRSKGFYRVVLLP